MNTKLVRIHSKGITTNDLLKIKKVEFPNGVLKNKIFYDPDQESVVIMTSYSINKLVKMGIDWHDISEVNDNEINDLIRINSHLHENYVGISPHDAFDDYSFLFGQ